MPFDPAKLAADAEAFCQELRPHEELCYAERQFNDRLVPLARKHDLLGINLRPEYGGRGADNASYFRALARIGREGTGVRTFFSGHLSIGAYPIQAWGSDALKRKYLPAAARGDAPVYRAFSGQFLAERRAEARPTVDRDQVERWVRATWGERWSASTRLKFAGNLLTAAGEAGLVAGRTNPRKLVTPRVSDDALTYLLHLLREVRIEGKFLDNPYLASVALDPAALHARLSSLRAVQFRQLGDVVDFEWTAPSLRAWAERHKEVPPA